MKSFYLLFVVLMLSACGAPTQIDSFNTNNWQIDVFGCEGKRMTEIVHLEAQVNKLKGLKHDAIVDLLGKPDEKELYNRGQWFYVYYLDKGPKCMGGETNRDIAKRLTIRFSALGKVSEIIIRK